MHCHLNINIVDAFIIMTVRLCIGDSGISSLLTISI